MSIKVRTAERLSADLLARGRSHFVQPVARQGPLYGFAVFATGDVKPVIADESWYGPIVPHYASGCPVMGIPGLLGMAVAHDEEEAFNAVMDRVGRAVGQ